MLITYLGTGTSQGVPLIGCNCVVCTSTDKRDQRLRSSVMVQTDTTTIVVDAGPDFRQQMLREKVKSLDAILLTHSHKDHIAGLDDVRAFNYILNRPIDVYGNEFTLNELTREFPYIFNGTNYPGIPKINTYKLEAYEQFTIGDIHVQVLPVMHLKLPVWCYMFNKQFAYITDANYMSDETKAIIKNVPVLTLNALRHQKHISHYCLQEAIELAQELNVGTAYFTHISHQLGLYAEVQATLPNKCNLAYDGLQVQL